MACFENSWPKQQKVYSFFSSTLQVLLTLLFILFRWTRYEFIIGKLSENFTIILEVVPAAKVTPRATVAFDNIAMTHCYSESDDTCIPHQYRCKATTTCINTTKICDIAEDCEHGDDETQNCGRSLIIHIILDLSHNVLFADRMPYGSRCNFEEDWCGWYNVEGKSLEWARHNGSTPTNDTGPNYDHTFLNKSGQYLYVNMLKEDASFASSASLKSVIFNPPPRVHGNSSSRFYNSCAVRLA